MRLLEDALAAAPADDAATSARLSVGLSTTDGARARDLSSLAMEQAQRAGDPPRWRRRSTPSASLCGPRTTRTSTWPSTADARRRRGGRDGKAVLQARNWRVVDLLELGRVRDAAAEIDAYEALADAVALPHFRWYGPLWRDGLTLLAGRRSEARELTQRALALGCRADDPDVPLFVGIQRELSLQAERRIRRSFTARDSWRAPRPHPPLPSGPRPGAGRRRDRGDRGRAPPRVRRLPRLGRVLRRAPRRAPRAPRPAGPGTRRPAAGDAPRAALERPALAADARRLLDALGP